MGGGGGGGRFSGTIGAGGAGTFSSGTLYAAAANALIAGGGVGGGAGKEGSIMGLGSAPPYSADKYEDLPINEKLCAQADVLKADSGLMQQMEFINQQSEQTGLEHGGWIVHNPSDGFRIHTILVGNEKEIDLGAPPPNSVGSVHTHPRRLNPKPSDQDRYHAARKDRKVDINITLGGMGDAAYLDNTGRQFRCDGSYNWFGR